MNTSTARSILMRRYGLDSRNPTPESNALRSPFLALAPAQNTIQRSNKLDILQALKKPHILILGETNGGKSTLVKYLVSHAGYPAIAIDPHASKTSWQGMTVVGAGRKFEAIAQELKKLCDLMTLRSEQHYEGKTDFEPLIVIIDEFPAIVANKLCGKAFAEDVMLLIREARKFCIKLIVLSIGSEVRALGIEGQGSIRECFAIIRLSKFAKTHAKTLGDERIKLAIDTAQFPALLDDDLVDIPVIDRVNIPSIPLPQDYMQISGDAARNTVNVQCENVIDEQIYIDALTKLSEEKGWLTASIVKQYSRKFADISPDQIREIFIYLASNKIGLTLKSGNALEWRI